MADREDYASTDPDADSNVLAIRYLDGSASPEEVERFGELLAADAALRDRFANLCILVVGLDEASDRSSIAAKDVSPPGIQAPRSASGLPILGFLDNAWHGTSSFLLSHEFFTSYLVATLFFGIAALIGLNVYVSSPQRLQVAGTAPPVRVPPAGTPRPSEQEKPIVQVGSITGMVECKWADDRLAPAHNLVALGAKYGLVSGLMEITYKTGAKVILQGPCTYEAESAAGGFLSLGKLTARVETAKPQAANQKSEIRNQKSPFPLPHSPLFVVRTPTAVVTDLGTEFGVEVDRKGESRVAVFVGEVVAETLGASARPVHLKAGDVGQIDLRRNITVEKSAKGGRRFVRMMSQWPHLAAIANPSFEHPHILPGEAPYFTGIFEWQCDRFDDWGVNRYGDEFNDPVPDGEQLGFINAGQMWQELSERLAPNTKYTLSFWVGNRGNLRNKQPLNPDYTVELAAGDATLISEKNPVLPKKGKFAKTTLTYTTGDEHPALGKRLKIILRSNVQTATSSVQNHFDNIQLEVTPMNAN